MQNMTVSKSDFSNDAVYDTDKAQSTFYPLAGIVSSSGN